MVRKHKVKILLLILVPLVLSLVIGAIVLLSRKKRTNKRVENEPSTREDEDKKPQDNSNPRQNNSDPGGSNTPDQPPLSPPSQPTVPPEPLPPVKPLEGLKDGYGQIGLIKSLDSLLLSGVLQDISSVDKSFLPSKDEKRVVPHSHTTIGSTERLFARALDSKVYPEMILASLNKTFLDSEGVLVAKNLGSDLVNRPISNERLDSIGALVAKPIQAEKQLEICSMIFLQGKENVIQGLYRLGLSSFSLDRVWLDFLRVFENRLGSNGMIDLHPQQYLDRLPFTKMLLVQFIERFDGDLAKWRGRDTGMGDPYSYGSYLSGGGSARDQKRVIDQLRTDDLRELSEAFNRAILEITSPRLSQDNEKGFMTSSWKARDFKVYVPAAIIRGDEVVDHLFLRYCFICGCNSASSVNEQALEVASTVLTSNPKLEANAREAFIKLLNENFSVGDAKYPAYCRIPSSKMTNWSYELVSGKPHLSRSDGDLFYKPEKWEDSFAIQRINYIPRKSNVNAEVSDAILLGFLPDRKIAGRILAGHALAADKKLINDFFDRLDFGLVSRNIPIRMAGSHSFDTRFGMIIIHGFKVEDDSLPVDGSLTLKGEEDTLRAFLAIASQQDIPRIAADYKGSPLSKDKPSTLGDLFFLGGYMIRKASLNEDLEYVYDQVSHSAVDNLSVDERLLITNAGTSCIYRVLCNSAKDVLSTLAQQEKNYLSSITVNTGQASPLSIEQLKTNGEDPEPRMFAVIDDVLRSSDNSAQVLRGDSEWWSTQFPDANRYVISLIKFI